MSKNSNFVSLKDALSQLVDTYRLRGKLNETELTGKWEQLMGPVIARKTETIYIKDRVLYIRMTSPALRQELGYSQKLIIEKVNESLGQRNAIREVRFL